MGTSESLAGVDAVVLAGGRGTRLGTRPGDVPKPLRPVGGRPFIDRLLAQLRAAGARRVVLALGYAPEAFRAHVATCPVAGLDVELSVEDAPLDTGGALRHALPLLGSGEVVAMNGDCFADADLGAAVAEHRLRGARASVLLSAVEDASRYGVVELGASGEVAGFREKAAAGPALVNAGVYVLRRSVVEAIPAGRRVSLEREVLPSLVGPGFLGLVLVRRFLDIGTPESYAAAEAFFRETASP